MTFSSKWGQDAKFNSDETPENNANHNVFPIHAL